tara:strand:+ start:77 stop:469 length:393 start_codon:yes stop_codon:yes gene_type:complete
MADLLVTLSNPRGPKVYTESAATATLLPDVFGATASKLYAVKLDNSANTTEAVYLKLYENNSATAANITVGTFVPLFVLKAGASKTVEMHIPGGIAVGSGLYLHAAVVTAGGTGGTTGPTGTVAVTLIGE